MPLEMQAKLLRFLQEGTLRRIGSDRDVEVPVRVVAATNRNLLRAISSQHFREDLFYRINVVPIEVPPLRDRPGDIGLLSLFFLRVCCDLEKKSARILTEETVRLLERYYWPGNVRELRNLMHRLVIFSREVEIAPEELPEEILNTDMDPTPRRRATDAIDAAAQSTLAAGSTDSIDLDLEGREKQSLFEALERTGGNKVRAAKLLGISRASLYRKLEKYGLAKA